MQAYLKPCSDQNLDHYFSPARLVTMSILIGICNKYSKTFLKRPLKIDKTKFLMENGSVMKVKSIAAFCHTFDLH